MVTRVPMTVEGAERLRAELDQLKRVDRPRISKAIAEAREHGDLKENAEYHAAREQQSFAEGRISDIEARLSAAQIIDIKSITYSGRVIFGATVAILNLETDEKLRYQIVGEDEASVKDNKISVTSWWCVRRPVKPSTRSSRCFTCNHLVAGRLAGRQSAITDADC